MTINRLAELIKVISDALEHEDADAQLAAMRQEFTKIGATRKEFNQLVKLLPLLLRKVLPEFRRQERKKKIINNKPSLN